MQQLRWLKLDGLTYRKIGVYLTFRLLHQVLNMCIMSSLTTRFPSGGSAVAVTIRRVHGCDMRRRRRCSGTHLGNDSFSRADRIMLAC